MSYGRLLWHWHVFLSFWSLISIHSCLHMNQDRQEALTVCVCVVGVVHGLESNAQSARDQEETRWWSHSDGNQSDRRAGLEGQQQVTRTKPVVSCSQKSVSVLSWSVCASVFEVLEWRQELFWRGSSRSWGSIFIMTDHLNTRSDVCPAQSQMLSPRSLWHLTSGFLFPSHCWRTHTSSLTIWIS